MRVQSTHRGRHGEPGIRDRGAGSMRKVAQADFQSYRARSVRRQRPPEVEAVVNDNSSILGDAGRPSCTYVPMTELT